MAANDAGTGHMMRSVIGALALFVVLLVSGIPASAHSAAETAGFSREGTPSFMLSYDCTDEACPPRAGLCCPRCCQAVACSQIGCILAVSPVFSPIVFAQAVYDSLAVPRPDTAAPPPDSPPPRFIV